MVKQNNHLLQQISLKKKKSKNKKLKELNNILQQQLGDSREKKN